MTGGHDQRGQVALYAVLMLPLLTLVLALVLAVGTLEGIRSRLRAQLDMAALVATQALDPAALAAGEPPRLAPGQADLLAREYLARNLDAGDGFLTTSASELARSARVTVSNPGAGSVGPPIVTIAIAAPVRIPLLGLAGLAPVVTVTVDGAAAART